MIFETRGIRHQIWVLAKEWSGFIAGICDFELLYTFRIIKHTNATSKIHHKIESAIRSGECSQRGPTRMWDNSLAEIDVGRCAIPDIATSSRAHSCLLRLSTASSLFATATYTCQLQRTICWRRPGHLELVERQRHDLTCTTNAHFPISSQDLYTQEDMIICP